MKHRNLIISTLALILMAGCTDSVATGVEPDDLAGIWTAQSLVCTSVEGSMVSADEVAEGALVTLVLVSCPINTFT